MKFPTVKLPGLAFSKKQIARVAGPIAVLALIASVVAGRERPAPPAAEPAARIQARIEPKEQDLDLSRLVRPAETPAETPAANPFARRSFAKQAEAAPPQAPAAPAAPPLPFRYVGKLIEDGELAVFLARGEESFSVKKKNQRQKLDEQYRVDKVSENRVTFTYLPLKIQQTLDIPAVN
jgi:hypothetical protein